MYDINHIFIPVPASYTDKDKMKYIQNMFIDLAEAIDKSIKHSDAKHQALLRLKEASMWTNEAISKEYIDTPKFHD